MFWLGMILTMILAQSLQWWSEWGFRIAVVSSLGANLVVGILSGTRRRSAPRWLWALLGEVAKLVVWLAYQVAEAATTSALGSLSLCGSDASEEEKQVVAFWAPFLLLHLGGPDNLTAYALEDNKISNRKWLEIVVRILGVIYTIYNNTHRGGRSWALLLAASVVMLVAGAVRYVERANALRKANLDSMQEDASSSSSKDDIKMLKCRIKRAKRQGQSFRDGEALLLAQDLFPIWRHALVDSSVNPASPMQKASEMILSEWDWESMCMVAEMELSLIYEFLYTKAILAHTWHYYLIRLLSPLFTAAAAFLFCFWLHPDKQQQGDDGHRVRGSFVGITYALLAITFLMDVAWLMRALGSTWAYAYFQAAGRRWWCSIHRIVVRLDPLQLFCRDPQAINTEEKQVGQEKEKEEKYTRMDIRTRWGHKAFSCAPEQVKNKLKKDEQVKKKLKKHGHKAFSCAPEQVKKKFEEDVLLSHLFGEEFEEDVILWHIATCMVLVVLTDGRRRLASAIGVMSEYMMFLVAVRRQMLPGLVLHSQLQVTRKKLVEIWDGGQRSKILPDREKSIMNNKEKLAMILRRVRIVEDDENVPSEDKIEGNEGDKRPTTVESRAAPRVSDEMLEFIFNVWVDKLVYAAVRCSREAHAKQLSAGGDLTTVLWMLIQHAGPFCIGEKAKSISFVAAKPKKEEEEKKKDDAKPPLLGSASVLSRVPSILPPIIPPVCPPYYGPSWPPRVPLVPQCPRNMRDQETNLRKPEKINTKILLLMMMRIPNPKNNMLYYCIVLY
ncbi:unnamed protein product [Miscanthus lutarioriparius]|uniref:DUF4220 domain-containing protein n=1 Tax=Miscanthus lutarioriparius TaxID=422564 RepID=A0A811RCD6_9POAL|nr:unnamed protein product [Miscanthus lutarioriparius]